MLIYKATFPNRKSYIGQTANSFNIRIQQHYHGSLSKKRKKKDTFIFHKAIRKYDWENILWEILEDNIQDETILNERETFNILKYDTYRSSGGYNGGGYNMTLGGEIAVMRGQTHSLKTKKKMSKNHANVIGINNPFFNKKHTKKSMKQILKNQKRFNKKCVICDLNFKGHRNQRICFNRQCKNKRNVLKSLKYWKKNKEKIALKRKQNNH